MPPRFLFRLYPLASVPGAWAEQRLSPAGKLVIGVLIAACLFGIDIRQTVSYQLAGLMFALIASSMLFSLRWKPKLKIRRILPEQVTASVPACYWLEISNLGSRTERDLIVHDRLQQPRISYEQFQLERAAAGRPARNRFDRAMGFHYWVRMRHHGRGVELEALSVPPIAPGATTRIKVPTTIKRRGWIHFAAIQLLRPDPLGLFRARHSVVAVDELLSLPTRYPAPSINLRSQRRYQKGGVSLAMAVGDSQEFASLRDYRAGDPRKHIHWRSLAKTGALIVKEYQDEFFDRHALVIDTHIKPAETELFEGVVSVAASIATGQRPRDSILDVIFAGQDTIQLSEGRGLGEASLALTYLAEAKPSVDANFDRLAETIRARADRLASIIFVLALWDEPRRSLVEELAMLGLPTLCLRLSADDDTETRPAATDTGRCFTIRTAHIATDLAGVEFPG